VHITVIAKEPVAGRVKTRLCPPCTPCEAAEVAAAALADTLDAVAAVAAVRDIRPTLLLDGRSPEWVPEVFDVVAQCAGGLGDRLAHGFDVLGPGVVVGMDTPAAIVHLPLAISAVMRSTDALGLADDGGYWVIGLATVDRRIFDGIEMSTAHTGRDQLRRLRALGRQVTMLPTARDLDDDADLIAAAARTAPSEARLAQVTRRIARSRERADSSD
jgi:hypothetical protein